MTQVVQAKCPHCKNVLRIPVDWLSRNMRCKFCKQVIQARHPTANGAPAQAKQTKASGKASADDPFSFEEAETTPAAPPRRKQRPAQRGKGWLIAAGIVGVLALGATLSLVFAGEHIRSWLGFGTTEHVENGGDGDPKKNGKKTVSGAFPRAALLINVNNYWLLNPVHYGSPESVGYPGSSTNVLASRLSGAPMYFPATRVTELSDSAASPITPSKAVIETSITDFVATARPQDRVLILFAGHAIDIEKEAYLVPFEGNREDPKTLIPLAWVYDKLANCPARQKVLVLDVFRFPPARGFELPGTGAMTEDFEAKLHGPPPGVQVWASCTKDQQSIEFGSGSLFMQSLCHSLKDDRQKGFASPEDPIPVETLATKVNERMKTMLSKTEHAQASRWSGKEADGGAAYDASEPLPPKLALKPPAPPLGDDKAGAALVNNILAEMKRIPPMKDSLKSYMENMKAEALPPFSKKVMDFYKSEYTSWNELEKMAKDSKEKFPLRATVLKAIAALQKTESLNMRDKLAGPIDEKQKAVFLNEQKEPGLLIYELEEVLAEMKDLEEERTKEPSKRWQAHFDYAMARLQSRLIYINEYNYILGDIRADRLPTLEGDNTGWQLGSKTKVSTNESKVKTMVKDNARLWKKIADDHPGTPWAMLAQREGLYAMGLEWRATRD